MTFGPVDGEMQELTYDCRNRLIEAGGVTYSYDAENTRIATTVDGRTTEYVTDTGGSLSRMLIAYEADGTETSYYYGAEGLSGQYNDGTKESLYYHYDNIGSTTLLTNQQGSVVNRFVYGTYGELLSEVTKKVRFLYNGAYGVTTDENGLYYMWARYYNPDIKRFINQDIKVGDIGSSQSLNRYAYCEGNPVSLIDPFGLNKENPQDQGKESKYQWLHNLLGWGGVIWDGFDFINGLIYAAEGDKLNAIISLACGIPVFGSFVAGVTRGAKTVRAISATAKIVDVCKTAGKLGNVAAGVQAAYETYQYAQTKCETTEGKLAYIAGTMAAGFLMGKAAKWGAGKLKNLASKAMPKFKTTLQEGAGKFVKKASEIFSSIGNRFKGSTTNYKYNMITNPGPLAAFKKSPASNFKSGKYNIKKLKKDTVFYRAGEKGNPLGQWFTRQKPESSIKVRIDTAVKPQWIDPVTNEMTGHSYVDTVYAIKIPKGTTIYEGPVGYQGGVYLGGENIMQTFIPEPWKLDVEVLEEIPLN